MENPSHRVTDTSVLENKLLTDCRDLTAWLGEGEVREVVEYEQTERFRLGLVGDSRYHFCDISSLDNILQIMSYQCNMNQFEIVIALGVLDNIKQYYKSYINMTLCQNRMTAYAYTRMQTKQFVILYCKLFMGYIARLPSIVYARTTRLCLFW